MVKQLPGKHKDVSSIPRNHIFKKAKHSMLVCMSNPSQRETKTGRFLGSLERQITLLGEFQAREILSQINKVMDST